MKIVEETQNRFPDLACVSWDKGAHSQQNQLDLKELLDLIVLPIKAASQKLNGREKALRDSSSCAANTLRWNPPSSHSMCMDWINARIMESLVSNVMSPWLWSRKTSSCWGLSYVNWKNNGSIVKEDHTKKRPDTKINS